MLALSIVYASSKFNIPRGPTVHNSHAHGLQPLYFLEKAIQKPRVKEGVFSQTAFPQYLNSFLRQVLNEFRIQAEVENSLA
jgi:hypothetical protein